MYCEKHYIYYINIYINIYALSCQSYNISLTPKLENGKLAIFMNQSDVATPINSDASMVR